jgi:TusA-related sulfurtransferase
MSDNHVDARGLSCPQPVIMTQNAINDGRTNFEVLVSTAVSKENVMRCATKNKMNASFREEGEDFIITISKGE